MENYALIRTGGKQYRVSVGDIINVELMEAEVGKKIKFDQVLSVGAGADIKVGTPLVDGATVEGTVLKIAKEKKIISFKHKQRKTYRSKSGHRQKVMQVQIDNIK